MSGDNAVLELLSSAGEDHDDGPSRTWAALKCARRVLLGEQQEEQEAQILAPHNEARNVGTIVHKLVECYHTGVDPELYVPLRSDNEDIERLLNGPRSKNGAGAWIIFNDYVEEFPPGFWGRLIGAELRLSAHMDDGTRRSGVLDALWNMNAAAVRRVQDYFEVELNGPGVYVWDLKTGDAKSANLLADWEWHPQPPQYMLLAESANETGGPVRGAIVCKATGYKSAKKTVFQAAFIPSPDEAARMRWERQVEDALWNLENNQFNTAFCNEYHRECPFKTSGECEGV